MEEGLLTLGVDTSTERRSVALVRGGRVLSASASGLREGGSAGLLADVERVLASASLGLKDVGLFAAAAGPGSFTGLRSGLATVKGLALTLRKPAVGVPTLHAVAHCARPARRVVALIPAGRGEVFAQLLGVSAEGFVTEFREQIRQAAESAGLDFGDSGAGADAADGAWVLAPSAEALAESVAALALARFKGEGAWDAGSLGAIYVRPSDAELKGQWHAQG